MDGVSGACYAHKVRDAADEPFGPIRAALCFSTKQTNMSAAGHVPGCGLHLQEAHQRWHPEPGVLHRPGKDRGHPGYKCRLIFLALLVGEGTFIC